MSLAILLLDPVTLIYFVLIATLHLSVNFLLFYIFRTEESASEVAIFNFLMVVWSIILDLIALGYKLNGWWEVVGGLIVLISTSVIIT